MKKKADIFRQKRKRIERLEIISIVVCIFIVIWDLVFLIFFIRFREIIFLILLLSSIPVVFFYALWSDRQLMYMVGECSDCWERQVMAQEIAIKKKKREKPSRRE
jgi:hypothetical protein